MLYRINRQKTRTSRPICTTLNVAKLFYPYAIYELQYNLAVVILWQMLVCTYSSETEAKDELPYNQAKVCVL